MTIRLAIALLIFMFACGLHAQAPVITPTNVNYDISRDCAGQTDHSAPMLMAGGGSGNYQWAALSPVPPGLTFQTDGTFSGQLTAGSGIMFTFDVEVTDTTSTLSSQATITMEVFVSTATCGGDDDPACSTGILGSCGLVALLALLGGFSLARRRT